MISYDEFLQGYMPECDAVMYFPFKFKMDVYMPPYITYYEENGSETLVVVSEGMLFMYERRLPVDAIGPVWLKEGVLCYSEQEAEDNRSVREALTSRFMGIMEYNNYVRESMLGGICMSPIQTKSIVAKIRNRVEFIKNNWR